MIESEKYRQDLSELGIKKGDVVMVHYSMKAMGTKRKPEEIIEDIKAVLGEEGTLLMPALTYDNVTPENPVFDSEKNRALYWSAAQGILENARCGAQP